MTESPILDDVIEGHVHEEEVEFGVPEWFQWYLLGALAGAGLMYFVIQYRMRKRAKAVAEALPRIVVAIKNGLDEAAVAEDKSDANEAVQGVS